MALKSRNPKHLARVAQLPCCICGARPVHVHHIRTGQGLMRAKDEDTIPLCPEHHQGNTGIHGLGRKRFEREHGVIELDLLEDTKKKLTTVDTDWY